MAYYRTDDSQGTLVSDTDPGDGWVEITESQYDTLSGSFPNPVHDDVHTFLDGAGISDPDARAAFHRLFGLEV